MMRSFILSLLRWPIWVIELGTGAKSFVDNPLIGSRRLNRLGLHRTRVRAAHVMTAWRRRRLFTGLSAEDRDTFARQGFVEWRDVLPADAFERMRQAILARAWPAREMAQGHAITRRIAVDDALLSTVPDLATLLRAPRWRALIRHVAATRAEPLYYIQTILTHAAQGGDDPQTDVHADAFHPSMKAWLFLTDVMPEDGPLLYVPGSHRLTPARLAWEHERALRSPGSIDRLSARGSPRIARADMEALGLGPPRAFAVPANTLVIADMFGFHARGSALRPSMRIELWAYARRNPFLPWTGLHWGSLPGVARRRIAMIWSVRDRLADVLGQPWRAVGDKRPDAP